MKWAWNWWVALGSSALLAGTAGAANPHSFFADILGWRGQQPSASAPSVLPATPNPKPASPPAAQPAPPEKLPAPAETPADPELQKLLDRMAQLSEQIGRNAESPGVWEYQLAQGEVMLQIAARSKAEEQERWLRMAIDTLHSAVVQAPDNDSTAQQRMGGLAQEIARNFPRSSTSTYAALQDIRAGHIRALSKPNNDSAKVKEQLIARLVQFANEYPQSPEAPKVIWEAAGICKELGKTKEARRCYRHLAEHYAAQGAGRKAAGALWRMGMNGEQLRLNLPMLFGAGNSNEQTFDMAELHGKYVLVYFWSGTGGQTAEDFRVLKHITDRYPDGELEAVYVNLDNDPSTARAFLAGQLTAGTHLHQRGGLESATAERYGIQSLPQVFLLGRDGTVVGHTQMLPQMETEVASHLPRAGRH
jgi:hypothetical protein